MENVEYLIIGAGVSGLAFAATLKSMGIDDFVVLEKEDEAGGLCRSKKVDEFDIDIGGGHFLDTRNQQAQDFLLGFMEESQWKRFSRKSTIETRHGVIDYPFEANIWQFTLDTKIEYLKSIAQAGCNSNISKPEIFSDWIRWKLGDKIAADYLLPYNSKIFGINPDELGTYWLEKLPNVSFEQTLRSCFENRPSGEIPAHAEFLYPEKHGYGKVWNIIADELGSKLLLEFNIENVNFREKIVNGEFRANKIINTIPWHEYLECSDLPDQAKKNIHHLKYSGIDVDYYSRSIESDSHWIYVPDMNKTYHRILCRGNFMAGAPGYWTETNSQRNASNDSEFRHTNKYAYPLNTLEKPAAINNLLEWAETLDIYGLGRWGVWEHMNSDIAVSKAITLAHELSSK